MTKTSPGNLTEVQMRQPDLSPNVLLLSSKFLPFPRISTQSADAAPARLFVPDRPVFVPDRGSISIRDSDPGQVKKRVFIGVFRHFPRFCPTSRKKWG